MNMSDLIFDIKTDLGIYAIALPLDDIDGTLVEVIKRTTLKTYSQFFPQYELLRLKSIELEKISSNKEYIEIKIPVPNDQEIVFVEDVYQDSNDVYGVGYYGAGMPIHNTNMMADLMLTNIGADMSNMAYPKFTFEFLHPNKLKIYNFFGGSIVIKYAKLHNKDLSSIPMSQYESFKKLAIIDCKKALYGIIKHYNELETAHGRINLRIDDWAESVTERKEVLNEWTDIFHLERKSNYYV